MRLKNPTLIIGIAAIAVILLLIVIRTLIFTNKDSKLEVKDYRGETTISLSKSDFSSGIVDDQIHFNKDNNYLCIKAIYRIDSSSYRISINSALRLIINEYTEDNLFIKSTDLGDHDIFSLNEDTDKVSFSLYEYESGELVTNTKESLEEQLTSSINLEQINNLDDISEDDSKLSTYISSGSLSNYSNYRVGYYLSWGGSYSSDSGSYCTRDFYRIDADKTYCVNVNDYRVNIEISEYDENGKWLDYAGSYKNLSSYKAKNPECAYIGIILRSSDWGSDCLDLLKDGLVIDFSDSFRYETLENVSLSDFDFTDFDNYESGRFYKEGIAVESSSLRVKYYLNLEASNSKYLISLSNHYLTMQISEFDSEGNYLQSNSFENGEFFTPSESTNYIAVSVSANDTEGYTFFEKLFKENVTIDLSLFTKYEHNTNMSDLSATDFVASMNVGWNLGNSLDSHYGDRGESANLEQETSWGNPTVSKDLIDYVKESGFNTIRIPVTWYNNTYVDSNGNLKVYEEWLDRVQTVVDYALEDGLYVILDTHHEQEFIYAGVSDEEMENVYANAAMLWSEIANYFKDYDEHLIFESYNEVDNLEQSWNYSAKAAQQVNKLNQIFVDTVRETGGNNTDRLLMIPTLLDGAETNYLESFVVPEDSAEDRLILTVHDYSTVYTDEIDSFFANLEEYSKKYELPIIIGEFGSSNKSFKPVKYRDIHASNYVANAANHGIKCIYWDNGSMNDYAIINRKDLESSRTDIIEALINPSVYMATNSYCLDSMENFLWMRLNQTTGELVEDKYWGTIVTGNQATGIEISENINYISLNLNSTDGYATTKIHYVHFYDENMNVIETNNSDYGYKNNTFEVPEGAKYIRVGINDSYQAITKEEYSNAFNAGKLSLSISYIDTESSDSIMSIKH